MSKNNQKYPSDNHPCFVTCENERLLTLKQCNHPKRLLFTMILLMGLFLSFNGYSKNKIVNNDSKVKSTEIIERPNSIFFAPLNLFDIENPNFQIGYERFVAKRWALQIEGGIIINHSIENFVIDLLTGNKDCQYTNKGFRVKGSVKYILINKRKMKLYVSPELFYLKNKSGIVRDFLISDPDFEYSFGNVPEGMNGYSSFIMNDEEKMGVNFKVGIKLLMGKRFFMEPHLGIGFAYRNVIQTGIENPDDKAQGLWGIFDKAAPNKWAPTLPLNFKLGFRF